MAAADVGLANDLVAIQRCMEEAGQFRFFAPEDS